MSEYEKQLDRMLSRGRLTPDELDRTLGAVFEQTAKAEKKPAFSWRWALVSSLSFGAFAAAFLVLTDPFDDEFRTRGAAGKTAVSAECAAPCQGGSALVFRAGALDQRAYLVAYSQNEEARVWYYPAAHADPPAIEPSAQDRALPEGATIGAEHKPGKYVTHVYLLSEPLSREAAAALRSDDARILGHAAVPLQVSE